MTMAFGIGVLVGSIGNALAKCGVPGFAADVVLLESTGTIAAPDAGELWIDDRGPTFTVRLDLDSDDSGVPGVGVSSSGNPEPKR